MQLGFTKVRVEKERARAMLSTRDKRLVNELDDFNILI